MGETEDKPKFVTPENDWYGSLPVREVAERASQVMGPNVQVFFKFTCGNCGSRQTFDTPNTLYMTGKCEECGEISLITRVGFAIIMVM